MERSKPHSLKNTAPRLLDRLRRRLLPGSHSSFFPPLFFLLYLILYFNPVFPFYPPCLYIFLPCISFHPLDFFLISGKDYSLFNRLFHKFIQHKKIMSKFPTEKEQDRYSSLETLTLLLNSINSLAIQNGKGRE